MVTSIRQRSARRRHLYISERMEKLGLSDEAVAGRLGVARETVWRWRTQQHRLNPEKIASLAAALDCEPEDLWRPPGQQSVDAMLKDAPEDLRRQAAELVAVILKTGT
jgi:transcriptional regulator with XRE-family HTH domain